MSLHYLFIIPCYRSYENPDIALNCGVMLRECVKHEPLAKLILESECFYLFYTYVEMSTFDIASDAFSTFKVSCLFLHHLFLTSFQELLTRHKVLCAQFLEYNYDKVSKCEVFIFKLSLPLPLSSRTHIGI